MIAIFVRKITGKGEKIQLRSSATIGQLITQIENIVNSRNGDNKGPNESAVPAFNIYYKGEELQNNRDVTLEQAGIVNNAIVHLVERREKEMSTLRIKLILESKLLDYEISQEATILDLKEMICEDLEIKRQQDLTLSFLGAELDNSKKIKNYQFVHDILISAAVDGPINLTSHKKSFSLSKQSQSEQFDNLPKINRESDSGSPNKLKRKAQSMNTQIPNEYKNKAVVFNSVNLNNLNKIDEKIEECRNESQLNETQQIEEEIYMDEKSEKKPEGRFKESDKPRITLDSLSKNWQGGNGQIIETQSIIDDEEQQNYLNCMVEIIRSDQKRQYVLDCTKQISFQCVLQKIAALERISQTQIKLNINFDEVSKSGISSRSSKGVTNSPRSATNILKQRSSLQSKEVLKNFQYKHDHLKMAVVDYASKLKKKQLSFEFEVCTEI